MATTLQQEDDFNITTNKTAVIWWSAFCGNSSSYEAFWVSLIDNNYLLLYQLGISFYSPGLAS